MLFKGTTVTEGTANAVVVATGMSTELGKIAELTESAESEATPLEGRLNRLAGRLAWLALGCGGVISVLGLWSGQPSMVMVKTAVALGVAAIPEGLPIVSTIALARGMWIMARRQALIKRLNAVETLGSTRIVLTDKTGTLTENRMEVRRIITPDGDLEVSSERPLSEKDDEQDELLSRLVEIGVLCSNASLGDDAEEEPQDPRGDPTEIALLYAGAALGFERPNLLSEKPEEREVSFSPETMMMATFHRSSSDLEVAVKGAPEEVLIACDRIAMDGQGARELDDEQRREWIQRSEALASEGLRLLGVADKRARNAEEEPYEGLRFVGLIGLVDPLRSGVKESIAACQDAGMRVIMVTGDKPETAKAIGRELGLGSRNGASVMVGAELNEPESISEEKRDRVLGTDIFARVRPEHKLDLIQVFQDRGEIVAMTGDGVNDTPALKKADIGVAMGRRGTEAARQAADMVLKDDAMSSIVAAIEQGRILFGNIRQSLLFMLATNVAEVIAVGLAALAGAPLPLKPLQILYLNVITDVFPALALAVGPGGRRVMRRPPRDPYEPILTRAHWKLIVGWGSAVAACVLAGLALAMERLDLDQVEAVTVSFLTLGFAKLWFVFNLRERGSGFLDNEIVRNRWIWGALLLCALLLFSAVYLPPLAFLLDTRPAGARAWLLVFLLSLAPFVAGQAIRVFQKGHRVSED
jgi:Ca2+-transporting ATPase